jgi:hypothetical protein
MLPVSSRSCDDDAGGAAPADADRASTSSAATLESRSRQTFAANTLANRVGAAGVDRLQAGTDATVTAVVIQLAGFIGCPIGRVRGKHNAVLHEVTVGIVL